MMMDARQNGSTRRGAAVALAAVAVALAGSIAYVVAHDRLPARASANVRAVTVAESRPAAASAAPVPTTPLVTSDVIYPPSAEIELNDITPPAHEKAHEKPAATPSSSEAWPEIPRPNVVLAAVRPEPANISLERALLVTEGLDESGKLSLLMNKSTVLATRTACKRVSVGAPEIADVNPIGANSLLITAKKPGATQLIVWDDGERSQVIDLAVTTDLGALQEHFKQQFPGSKIDVSMASAQLVLRGQVPSLQVAEQAVQLAQPYAPKVLNFLEVAGGQQVMLQVRFAEVSRSATNQLGFNFGSTDGTSFFGSNIGQVSPLGIKDAATGGGVQLGVQTPNPAVTLFGTGAIGNSAFAYYIAALRQNNLLRILAEPNLTAISGQEASFLAGGSFPVPVTQGGGSGAGGTAITVEYRSFGVKLRFTPVVLGDGKIRLKVAPEVSDLDFTTAVRFNGYVIPGLTERKLETVIEMREGQTFALAGLLNNNVSATKDVTPVLGDVPYLGALFRSVRYQRKETELVVIVTPRLVEALNPAQVPTLPGERWRHPTEGDLFWSRDIGGVAGDARLAPPAAAGKTAATGEPPRFKGQFGYTPPEDAGE